MRLRDGKIVGVAGVDLTLTSLQELVDAIRPFGTGRALLVSTAGAVVAGGDSEQASKPAPPEISTLATAAVQAGQLARAFNRFVEKVAALVGAFRY